MTHVCDPCVQVPLPAGERGGARSGGAPGASESAAVDRRRLPQPAATDDGGERLQRGAHDGDAAARDVAAEPQGTGRGGGGVGRGGGGWGVGHERLQRGAHDGDAAARDVAAEPQGTGWGGGGVGRGGGRVGRAGAGGAWGTSGYSEVRTMATQRLEMWLQNPKVRGGEGRGWAGAGWGRRQGGAGGGGWGMGRERL